jgi:hypothetical protein
VNFRTRAEHMDQLLDLLSQECRAALQSGRYKAQPA